MRGGAAETLRVAAGDGGRGWDRASWRDSTKSDGDWRRERIRGSGSFNGWELRRVGCTQPTISRCASGWWVEYDPPYVARCASGWWVEYDPPYAALRRIALGNGQLTAPRASFVGWVVLNPPFLVVRGTCATGGGGSSTTHPTRLREQKIRGRCLKAYGVTLFNRSTGHDKIAADSGSRPLYSGVGWVVLNPPFLVARRSGGSSKPHPTCSGMAVSVYQRDRSIQEWWVEYDPPYGRSFAHERLDIAVISRWSRAFAGAIPRRFVSTVADEPCETRIRPERRRVGCTQPTISLCASGWWVEYDPPYVALRRIALGNGQLTAPQASFVGWVVLNPPFLVARREVVGRVRPTLRALIRPRTPRHRCNQPVVAGVRRRNSTPVRIGRRGRTVRNSNMATGADIARSRASPDCNECNRTDR